MATRLRRWAVHLPFALVLLVASVPRIVAMIGYRPLLMFYGDSFSYYTAAGDVAPPYSRPLGYSSLIRLMAWTNQLSAVALVQHLAVLLLAVAIYAALLSLRAPVWLAVIVPLPMLLDGYQILSEHTLLTETMFTVLVVVALLLVLRQRVTVGVASLAGLLLAASTLTRTVALPLIAVVVAYLVVRRVRWTSVIACMACFSVPLLAYAGWYAAAHGAFRLQEDARFLYARVAPIAQCEKLVIPDRLQRFCDDTPPQERPGSNFYAWDKDSPFLKVPTGTPTDQIALVRAETQVLAREFAVAVIQQQPLDYASLMARDVVHYFGPGRTASPQDTPPTWWEFPEQRAASDQQLVLSGSNYQGRSTDPRVTPWSAQFLRTWQQVLGTQGLLVLLFCLLGVAGAALGRTVRRGARRADATLLTVAGLVLLVVPAATSVFDYRYLLPPATVLYLAGGWGLLLLIQRRRVESVETLDETESIRDDAVALPRRHRARATGRIAAGSVVVAVVLGAIVLSPMRPDPVYARYVSLGSERGAWGYPTTDLSDLSSRAGWQVRYFNGGVIYATPSGATYAITAVTDREYRRLGGLAVLGLPESSTGPLRGSPDEFVTWYERGAVVWSKDRGVRSVVQPFAPKWCSKAARCGLGAPLAAAQRDPDSLSLQQRFANGLLIVDADGVVQEVPVTRD